MIKTYGLTHIAISVQDIHRSSALFKNVFGAKKMYDILMTLFNFKQPTAMI